MSLNAKSGSVIYMDKTQEELERLREQLKIAEFCIQALSHKERT